MVVANVIQLMTDLELRGLYCRQPQKLVQSSELGRKLNEALQCRTLGACYATNFAG